MTNNANDTSEMTVRKCPIDFDHHSSTFAKDGPDIEAKLRAECPVGWSSEHGGYWVVTRHEDVKAALQNHELFFSNKTFNEDGEPLNGLMIPPAPGHRLVPDETDPPEWYGYRRLLNPMLAPPAVERLQSTVQAYSTEVINQVIESGSADLVNDILNPITAMLTLYIMGVDVKEWKLFAEPMHREAYDPFSPEVKSGYITCRAKVGELIAKARANPDEAIISKLVTARIDGELITDEHLTDLIMQLLQAGLDTTSSVLGSTLMYLETNPSVHSRIMTDDAFVRSATEEFVRWSSAVVGLARRTATRTEIRDQVIEAGEAVWLDYRSANFDESVFDRPDEVILDRSPNRHIGFGTGIHRCVGAHLARAIFRTVVRDVLRRMPDYRVDRDVAKRIPSTPVTNGWITMPVRFTPGIREESNITVSM